MPSPHTPFFKVGRTRGCGGVSTKDTSSRGGTPASIHTHSSPQLLHPTARMLGFCALHPRGARHSHLSPPPTPHHLHHHKARLNHFLRHSTDSENSRAPPLLHSPCSAPPPQSSGTSKLTHVTPRAFVGLRDHPLSHTSSLSRSHLRRQTRPVKGGPKLCKRTAVCSDSP